MKKLRRILAHKPVQNILKKFQLLSGKVHMFDVVFKSRKGCMDVIPGSVTMFGECVLKPDYVSVVYFDQDKVGYALSQA